MKKINLVSYQSIEQFEGPILELVTDSEGLVYSRKWCDRGISMLAPTTTARMKAYKERRISMLDLLVEFNKEVIIENLITNEYSTCKIEDLPPKYLPETDAFYEESLAPEEEES